jgi:hypothetical protein
MEILRENQKETLYPAELFFKSEGEIKAIRQTKTEEICCL